MPSCISARRPFRPHAISGRNPPANRESRPWTRCAYGHVAKALVSATGWKRWPEGVGVGLHLCGRRIRDAHGDLHVREPACEDPMPVAWSTAARRRARAGSPGPPGFGVFQAIAAPGGEAERGVPLPDREEGLARDEREIVEHGLPARSAGRLPPIGPECVARGAEAPLHIQTSELSKGALSNPSLTESLVAP